MSKITEQQKSIAKYVFDQATKLRGSMQISVYKDYIFGTIFYYFLSKKTDDVVTKLLKNDNISFEEAWKDSKYNKALKDSMVKSLGYVIAPNQTFEYFLNHMDADEEHDRFSADKLDHAIRDIKDSTVYLNSPSQDAFSDIFDSYKINDTQLGDTVKDRTKALRDLFECIDQAFKDVDFQNSEIDIFGNVYMEIMLLIGPASGKKEGEFFSPAGPVQLCCELATLGLDRVDSAADIACGSGSMLIKLKDYVKVGHYYGQEKNKSTYTIAKMNLILHGVPYEEMSFKRCDTLFDKPYDDEHWTVQVANPPYSLAYEPTTDMEKDDRYSSYGAMPPKNAADYLFLENMIHHMDDDGRIAVLLPHGILFRGASEETIRKYILKEQNYIDAVIGLPGNMFTTANIPVICLVLKKQRNENSDNIFFIDASKEFKTGKSVNVLEESNIRKIVDAYKNRKDKDGFCRKVCLDEIFNEDNDCNLNISRYISTFVPEEKVDVSNEYQKILKLDEEYRKAFEDIKESLKGIGIE